MAIALLAVIALAAAPPAPASVQGRATVTILAAAEVHFDRLADEQRPVATSIHAEDGSIRPALLVEFQ